MDGNTRAISIFTGYMLVNISLTALIVRDIYATLHTESAIKNPTRRRALKISSSHLVLAIICLAVTWYYMISFFSLSYRSWAHNHYVELPQNIYHALGDPSTIKLGMWLKDVQLFRDAWEVVVETRGRLRWSQPIFFITAGWSFFIAMQAHSKNIAHAWAYMVLGQLVAISFAMNLFFIAVYAYQLAEPALSERQGRPGESVKPHTHAMGGLWTPPVAVYLAITLVTLASILAVPGSTGTPYFLHILAISHVLLLLPPILCKLGIIFVAFGAIQSYTLWQASHDMTPDSHLHRHSNVYVRPDLATSNWLPRHFVPLMDHPAVSSVGWDSILCIVSMIVRLKQG